MTSLQKAVVQTLAYADVFDYPLKKEEIFSFLLAKKAANRFELAKVLAQLGSQIDQSGCFYFLKGRKNLILIRKKREKWSQKKLKIAFRTARWLKLIPWVQMVAVTGGLSLKNASKDDDIDFLIVAKKNRLWLSRFFSVLLVELMGRRRRPQDKDFENKICLNMFLDGAHLALPPKERDLFTAHEVIQLRPIWDRNQTYHKFIKANQWVKQFLPNWGQKR